MKKFYFLVTIAFISFTQCGYAQYTATNSGPWSSPITWAPGAIPSNPCNNCTITINANVTVTLDASVSFTGTTIMTIGTDDTNPAGLVITNSGAATFPAGHNLTLVNAGTTGSLPGIKLRNANTIIDGSAAGQFDGVFAKIIQSPMVARYYKLVGNTPGAFQETPGNFIALGSGFTVMFGTSARGPLTISSSGGPLPVELSAFDAVMDGKVVDLTWTTSMEVNSDHTDVERSVDGAVWNTLGTVKAMGNSSIPVNYSFTDVSPVHGTNYYRLRLVDMDGKFAFSQIKVVRMPLISGLSLFPNPTHAYVNLSLGTEYNGNLTIRLINNFGQVLQEKKLSNAAGTTVSFQVSNYAQGNYYLQVIQADGGNQTSKFIIAQ